MEHLFHRQEFMGIDNRNPYEGFFYASEAFVKLQTINIIVHKDAIPKDILKKLGINKAMKTGQTIIEKIIAAHADKSRVAPDDIVDVAIDCRVARDFGGANVVKNLLDHHLPVDDPSKTFFTFDCNPGGSDQKYAQNQHLCRQFAREHDIAVLDVDRGIGTHNAIDLGLAFPGSTFVSTDSHANIMGAIGCFGQGMGDQDIAAAWANGKVWFKVPHSVKLTLNGKLAEGITAKDIVLNLLHHFGANKLLGYSVELYGEVVDKLTLDERITIASMATEMGAIILLFTPTPEILNELEKKTGKRFVAVHADKDAAYVEEFTLDASRFVPMVARPGHPHDDIAVAEVTGTKIDSAFIGSCTNGRMEDLRIAATILKGKRVAPGVVLKIVPATDDIWKQALEEGLIAQFKAVGALVIQCRLCWLCGRTSGTKRSRRGNHLHRKSQFCGETG
jgi:homoaconitase/3-isopropylmalate dehydratase large subunit